MDLKEELHDFLIWLDIDNDVHEVHNLSIKEIVDEYLASLPEAEKVDFPDINFRKDIAEELSRDELIDRLCEMNKGYREMREEWFEKTQMQRVEKQVNDELIKASKEILHLHMCEQEGLLSGQPTPEQWYKAVNNLSDALLKIKEGNETSKKIRR